MTLNLVYQLPPELQPHRHHRGVICFVFWMRGSSAPDEINVARAEWHAQLEGVLGVRADVQVQMPVQISDSTHTREKQDRHEKYAGTAISSSYISPSAGS